MISVTKYIIGTMFLVTNISFCMAQGNKEYCIGKTLSPQYYSLAAKDSGYNMDQTLSDGAQRNTIAFDGLAFLTGSLGSQSFLPPGKVADFSGFQYLRDNDPTSMGHNTAFVTIISNNVLHILTAGQINTLIASAQNQASLINDYAYFRFPMMKAFRRLLDGDVPVGSKGLNKSVVMEYSGQLYRIDGQISYNREKLFGEILNSMTIGQKAALDNLKTFGRIGKWDSTLINPVDTLHLPREIGQGLMTYATEMYSWYAGSVDADVYFCPERQGDCFGGFYLKDWPAMGNPNYSINEQLTATTGQDFLSVLNGSQAPLVTGLVDTQKVDSFLYHIVDRRHDISVELRKFMTVGIADSDTVLNLSEKYGELDGALCYYYATYFTKVWETLDSTQKQKIKAIADSLGYLPPPSNVAFLYSDSTSMPSIGNTDSFFVLAAVEEQKTGMSKSIMLNQNYPNPSKYGISIEYQIPKESYVSLCVYDKAGILVKTVITGNLTPGSYTATWDRMNTQNKRVPSGIYFYRLKTDSNTLTKKMILLD
ncbi:MAG: T9SS type A sorting domain-containing protein [bacterium]|nr:T9SS type A sorting domain-containing protein [bacterium]